MISKPFSGRELRSTVGHALRWHYNWTPPIDGQGPKNSRGNGHTARLYCKGTYAFCPRAVLARNRAVARAPGIIPSGSREKTPRLLRIKRVAIERQASGDCQGCRPMAKKTAEINLPIRRLP